MFEALRASLPQRMPFDRLRTGHPRLSFSLH